MAKCYLYFVCVRLSGWGPNGLAEGPNDPTHVVPMIQTSEGPNDPRSQSSRYQNFVRSVVTEAYVAVVWFSIDIFLYVKAICHY